MIKGQRFCNTFKESKIFTTIEEELKVLTPPEVLLLLLFTTILIVAHLSPVRQCLQYKNQAD
jgi:hypothetical protein